jgi:hypothetical protein
VSGWFLGNNLSDPHELMGREGGGGGSDMHGKGG